MSDEASVRVEIETRHGYWLVRLHVGLNARGAAGDGALNAAAAAADGCLGGQPPLPEAEPNQSQAIYDLYVLLSRCTADGGPLTSANDRGGGWRVRMRLRRRRRCRCGRRHSHTTLRRRRGGIVVGGGGSSSGAGSGSLIAPADASAALRLGGGAAAAAARPPQPALAAEAPMGAPGIVGVEQVPPDHVVVREQNAGLPENQRIFEFVLPALSTSDFELEVKDLFLEPRHRYPSRKQRLAARRA
nr:TPA_asm: m87.5 ORF [Murid betaherpesvirus 1]DBA08031.1 TPA_asm: m87.5 ORF [Murid betaherpesvirus 1]